MTNKSTDGDCCGCFTDDGGGTPVQDEHTASDAEEVRSNRHHSEVCAQPWTPVLESELILI